MATAARTMGVKVNHLRQHKEWFEVIETTNRSQTAIMELAPGQETGKGAESHDGSDQVMLVVRGSVTGTVGDEEVVIGEGSFITIPAGVKHRFENREGEAALTFNVYAPAAYPPDAKG